MAQGYVKFQNPQISATVDKIKNAYAEIRRLMDALIVIRNGTDYQAVSDATGSTPSGASSGQTIFDNLDAALGGMTTANNALSNMDENAL
jgi:hypothetical protein